MRSVCTLYVTLLMAFLTAHSPNAQTTEPDRIHWVEVDWFDQREAAEALQARLISEGYAPVCVYPRGGISEAALETSSPDLAKAQSVEHSVRIGEFAIFMDALLLQQDLAELFPGDRVPRVRWNDLEAENAAGRTWDFRPLRVPERPLEIFNLSRVPLQSGEPLHFDHSAAPILEGGMITPDRAPSNAEEMENQSLALFRMTESNDDPVRGLALLNLADVRASQGDLQRALEIIEPLANGEVAASPEDRYTAMWTLARIYHAMGRRTSAYRAYREIESVATDDRDRARCLVEQDGLLMELARSDMGRLFDCRLLAGRILSEFGSSDDSEIHQRCATAALMSAETWFWERDYEVCAAACREVSMAYPDVRREWAVATFTLGYAHRELGRHEEALSILMEVYILSDWDPDRDDFPNFRMQAASAVEMIEILDIMGRGSDADELRREVIQRWPGTRYSLTAQIALDQRER